MKIVVIAGEDAVNIIQQKTAVNPIVEVRDRNDLPVAGAVVTFTIGGGQPATFGAGLQTLTVTTNAAGQAAAAGLTPTGSGALQINVAAAYQGQTASVTITQTNFATAAQAAQAAKAPGSSGASAGTGAGTTAGTAGAAGAGAATGGGLSGAAIGGIIAGGAVGGLVAAKAASGGSDSDTPGEPPAAACTFNVSPTSFPAVQSGGFSAFVNVAVSPDGCSPRTWTATSNASFIRINPATTLPATGTGGVELLVEQNTTESSRTGTVAVAGQTVTVTQAARCRFTVTPTVLNFPATGGAIVVTVTAAPAGCDQSTWPVTNIPSFVSVSATGGSGSGSITLTAQPNLNSFTRTDAISVAGHVLQIVQPGATTACAPQERNGGEIAETRTIELGKASGTFLFSYETGLDNPDRLVVMYEGRALFDTGCTATGTTRVQPLTYAGSSTSITIRVTPNCSGGTGGGWFFKVSCP